MIVLHSLKPISTLWRWLLLAWWSPKFAKFLRLFSRESVYEKAHRVSEDIKHAEKGKRERDWPTPSRRATGSEAIENNCVGKNLYTSVLDISGRRETQMAQSTRRVPRHLVCVCVSLSSCSQYPVNKHNAFNRNMHLFRSLLALGTLLLRRREKGGGEGTALPYYGLFCFRPLGFEGV